MSADTHDDNQREEAKVELGRASKEKILGFITYSSIKPRMVVYGNCPYFEISMKAYVGDNPAHVFHSHGIQLKKDPTKADGYIYIKDSIGRDLGIFSDRDFYDPAA